MRKLFLFLSFVLAVTLSLSSCRGKVEQAPVDDDQPMEASRMDTITVTSLVNQYLQCLHENNIDDAIGMLYYLQEDGTIIKLPEDMAINQRVALTPFLGKEFFINHIKFYKETDSQVKFSCKLFEKEKDDPRPNIISFIIRPMRINNSWYLTMADSHTDTVESKIDN